MLLHDASDLPLDLLRISSTTNWKIGQYVFFPITIVSWIYWRLWILPSKVMYSIAFESASLIFTDIPCKPGKCYWYVFMMYFCDYIFTMIVWSFSVVNLLLIIRLTFCCTICCSYYYDLCVTNNWFIILLYCFLCLLFWFMIYYTGWTIQQKPAESDCPFYCYYLVYYTFMSYGSFYY